MSAPVVRLPSDVPALRLWLLDQWMPGRTFREFAGPQLDASADLLPGNARHDRAKRSRANADWEVDGLRLATLWWVSMEMCDVLTASASAVPDDLRFEDLLGSAKFPMYGLIVFEKPWRGVDAYDSENRVSVDAMLWGVSRLNPLRPDQGDSVIAIGTSTYRRIDFARPVSTRDIRVATATGVLDLADKRRPAAGERLAAHALVVETGDDGTSVVRRVPWDEIEERDQAFSGEVWAPLGRSDWPVTDAIGQEGWPGIEPARQASYVEDRKVLSAFWTLVNQPGVAEAESVPADRPTARRAERAGVEKKLADVQVIRLRRPRREEGEPTEPGAHREWSHRWLVGYPGGFWRYQRVGKGRAERRLTWVRPHVKGPADKPLRTPERVNAWVK